MLKLKPNCECCDKDLPPHAGDAMICTFECTFCADCVTHRLPGGRCPNCGGELVRRPVRPAAMLAQYPASMERVVKGHAGCQPSPAGPQSRVSPEPV
ncbi:MAG TPA: DUF1272 domain-containing protein [Hyphomicrobiaceae bacterium]|jgi:hypothetical protein